MILNRNKLNSEDVAPVLAAVASENILDSLAMEFGDRQLREVCEQSPRLIARLLAAQVYRSCRNHLSNPHLRFSEQKIIRFLEDLTLSLKVDYDGLVYTEVEGYPWLRSYSYEEQLGSALNNGQPYGRHCRRERHGQNIYNFNINIVITAEEIQQLNVNPNKVINQIHKQVKEEISRRGE